MDARRRAHEREADARDPHAAARLLLEQVRAGELRREQLLLLAFAGHPGLQPLLAEDLAEWCAFHDLDGALDLILGAEPDALSLASWIYGLALFDLPSAARAVFSGLPAVAEAVAALEPDPRYADEGYYMAEFHYERDTALQLVNATLLAVMNWEATRATPLLRGELRRSEQIAMYLGSTVPDGFSSLFEVPEALLGWTHTEDPDLLRRRRQALEGVTTLLAELGLAPPVAYRSAQRAVLAALRP